MKNILFAASEAVPFIKTGGLADVVGSLPFAFDKSKEEVRIILPAYTSIPAVYRSRMEDLLNFMIFFNGRDRYVGIRQMRYNGILFYFVDNEEYFGGPGPYTNYEYDIEKFAFFSLAVLSALPKIGFKPGIIHCHDWHTGLIPVYLKTSFLNDSFYRRTKSVFTIHNLKFQGICDRDHLMRMTSLPPEFFAEGPLCSGSSGNMMRGALSFADAVTTVSESYAEEIKTPAYGEGLQNVLADLGERFCGIVNGIDMKSFDAAGDPALSFPFSAENLKIGKAKNKKALQQELGLAEEADSFLLGIVSRLTDQKGFDLLLPLMDKLSSYPFQLAVLGTGEPRLEDAFRAAAARYPARVAVATQYDEALSHRIYAGCDAFLMPSLFEPCGLSQLIALRYGTLPIVRATGGLKDTILSYDKGKLKSNGFVFETFDTGGLDWAIELAKNLFYNDRKSWQVLCQNAIMADNSWEKSAKKYEALYRRIQRVGS